MWMEIGGMHVRWFDRTLKLFLFSEFIRHQPIHRIERAKQRKETHPRACVALENVRQIGNALTSVCLQENTRASGSFDIGLSTHLNTSPTTRQTQSNNIEFMTLMVNRRADARAMNLRVSHIRHRACTQLWFASTTEREIHITDRDSVHLRMGERHFVVDSRIQ